MPLPHPDDLARLRRCAEALARGSLPGSTTDLKDAASRIAAACRARDQDEAHALSARIQGGTIVTKDIERLAALASVLGAPERGGP